MRKLAFYFIVFIQILLIAAISWQHTLIDQYGEQIKLRVVRDYELSHGSFDYRNNLYVHYEIGKIPNKLFSIDPEELSYNEQIYVLLEQDDEGFYVVKEASDKKLTRLGSEMMLRAKFRYTNPSSRISEVDYGIDQINKRIYERNKVNLRKPFIIEVGVAPWGQRKVVKLNQ